MSLVGGPHKVGKTEVPIKDSMPLIKPAETKKKLVVEPKPVIAAGTPQIVKGFTPSIKTSAVTKTDAVTKTSAVTKTEAVTKPVEPTRSTGSTPAIGTGFAAGSDVTIHRN